tara:strand:+ start:341 stop:463 length:123 start_codon:yes stop_codon:yes gene_type:complete
MRGSNHPFALSLSKGHFLVGALTITGQEHRLAEPEPDGRV